MSQRTPYWLDYLRHPTHTTAVLAGVAASVLASMPWGGNAFALGMLSILALEIVALAFVPSHPAFQEWADKKARIEARAALHRRLMDEIEAHGGSSHLASYEQMSQRVASLYRMAADTRSTLTAHDVEQLEDAALDYLRLCLSDAVMKEPGSRGAGTAAGVEAKLRDVQARLRNTGLTAQEAAQLRRAEADFADALQRQGRMASRRAMLDASLASMPLRMEEIYQMVMTSPRAGNLGSMLESSLAKLRITEEVSMELDSELGLGTLAAPAAAKAATPVPRRSATPTRH